MNLNLTLFSIKEQNLSEVVGLQGWHFDDPPKYWKKYSFEDINHDYWLNVCLDYWKLPFYVGAVYLLAIVGLQEFMKGRVAYKLKYPLFVWNMLLGIFSFFGAIRMAPAFLDVIFQDNGVFRSICMREGVDEPTAFWYVAFGLSKYIELGDTVFIILRKKPLVLLQWYHHLITSVTCWLVGPYVEPISRWYVVMNYGVHSMMYPYFALKVINIHIPKDIAGLITTMQLLQMIVGLVFNFYTIVLINNGIECSRHPFSITFMGFVYASFTILFGKLFYDLVVASKPKPLPAKKVE